MNKFQLNIFSKASYEIMLVFLQFFIISLHFFQWGFIPQKQIIQVSSLSYLVEFLIIIVSFIIMLVGIKDLGRNLSPFPRPINNSNLVTTGIYRFTRHPMYYSLIFISFGFFIIILVAIKDLGRNLSPFPRPINNSKLVTTGIYRFTRHPMYYSLIFISIGVFIIKLSIYYLFLTIILALIIKFKIALEEKYLINKFKNYLLYKNEVKV